MAVQDYSDLFEAAGSKHNVDPVLLAAVAMQESHGNPKALSPQGAVGLMQIMPRTAKKLKVDPTDPEQAVDGAARLLAESLDRNNGDVEQALGEYHGGPDRKLWGPKNAQYRADVMGRYGGGPQSAAPAEDVGSVLWESPSAKPAASDVPHAASATGGSSEVAEALWGDAPATPKSSQTATMIATPAAPRTSKVLGLQKGIDTPMDNAAIWLEGGLKKLGVPTDAINKLLGMPSAAGARDAHAAYVQAQADKGVTPDGASELAGNILGTIPAAFATKNPFIAGGLGGALTTKNPNDAGGVVKDMALGAAGGKIADFGMNRIVGAVAPKLSAGVQKLLGEGVQLTPGQMLGGLPKTIEDKLTSFPILGDMIQGSRARGMDSFNVAAMNRVLKPLGEALPKDARAGYDAVQATSQKVSDAYDNLLSGVTVKADKTFSTALGKIAAEARSTLPPTRAKQFAQITKDLLTTKLTRGGTMTGDAMKEFESRLGQLIAKYGSAADGDQQLLAGHLKDVQGEVRDLVGRNNPAVAARLKDINTAFANLVRVQKAAGSVAAEHGVFTPAQLVNAVKSADTSVRKNASAKGTALMQDFADAAKSIMPSKVPDSGTVGRFLMNALTAGGLGGASITGGLHPLTLAAGGASMLPYTKLGGKLTTKLLAGAPTQRAAVRQVMEKLRGPVVLGGAAAANQPSR